MHTYSAARSDASRATEALRTFGARLDGALSLPADSGYAQAQPWNRAVASEPRAVVHAATAQDVVAAVRFARGHGLRVAVRRTGHGAVPLGADVLLVHTAALDDCTVHAASRSARLGGGAVWQQVIDAAAPHGLAPVCGAAPNIGVTGLLTGGGVGPLARSYGISSDYVRALDVVTGDGQLRHVTPAEHEELFWGLRGGKATLGIVTAVDMELVPLADFYGGSLWFDAADTRAVLRRWRRICDELPEQGTTSAAIMQLPPLPGLPPQIAGRQTLAVRFAWTGDPAVGAQHLSALREAAAPVLDDLKVRPYTEIGQVHSDPVAPMPMREHSALLDSLGDEAIEGLLAAVDQPRNLQTIVELRLLGGAISRPPRHPSAFCHRDAAFLLFTSGRPLPDPTAITEQAARIRAALSPWTSNDMWANFATSDDPQQISRCYDRDTIHWLTTLGDQYDPDHVLHVGQVART